MPVGARPAAHPVAAVEDLARADALAPGSLDPLPVVAVDRLQPALAQVLLGRLPGDPAPLRRVLGDLAVRPGHPDHLRAGLHERAVPLLAAPQCLGGLVLRGDVDGDRGDAADVAVPRREPGERPVPDRGILVRGVCRGDGVLGLRDRPVSRSHPAWPPPRQRPRGPSGHTSAGAPAGCASSSPPSETMALFIRSTRASGPRKAKPTGASCRSDASSAAVRDVEPGEPRARNGHAGAHLRCPAPSRPRVIRTAPSCSLRTQEG